MRRIPRVSRSIDLFRIATTAQTSSSSLCSTCRLQATSFSTTSTRTATPKLTERLRQKIWGTDTPPGDEDPYGGTGNFENQIKRVKEQRAAKQEAGKKEVVEHEWADSSTPISTDYEPAVTWDGLEKVGGYGNWFKENWDPYHQFEGFLPREVVTDAEELTAALHRAVVEVLALKQASKSLQLISRAPPGLDVTHDVQVVFEANKEARLQFPGGSTLGDIVQSLAPVFDETAVKENPTESEEDVAADRSVEDPLNPGVDETAVKENPTESEEDVAADRSDEDPLVHSASSMTYADLIASWDPCWLQAPLDDPNIKFAVIKRTLQLTGARIPDSAIKSAKTAQSLLLQLVAPPKPRKLIETLEQNDDLLNLPNVSVYAKRVTPIDKEKAVGRWKVIEKELIKRGLPVTGH